MTMPLKPKHHQIEVAGVESANNVVVKFRLCNRKRIGARTSERAARVRPPTLGGVRNSERLFLAAPNYALSAVHRGLVRQRLRTLSGKSYVNGSQGACRGSYEMPNIASSVQRLSGDPLGP